MSLQIRGLKQLAGKRIAFLGLGIEIISLVRFLWQKKIPCEITIGDAKAPVQLSQRLAQLKSLRGFQNVHIRTGKNYDKDLQNFEVIVRSPGYPLFSKNLQKAKKQGALITSATKLFFDLVPTKNIVGVTGTKGKGTTSSLIYNVLKTAGKKVYIGGNIGVPLFDFVDKVRPTDWVVLELSSFQLEDLEVSPRIAVWTNLYPEHLGAGDPYNPNFHPTFQSYLKAKLNLLRHQKKGDSILLHESLRKSLGKYALPGKKVYYTTSDFPSQLAGNHNRENVAAAFTLGRLLNIKPAHIAKAVRDFKGLPHRLQLVATKNGVRYYDDSYATTPEASLLALNAFSSPIILLAGGGDKGSDFAAFAKAIRQRVQYLVLFKGKGTERLRQALVKVKFPPEHMLEVTSMPQAFAAVKTRATKGDIVLLSAGCNSFGCFNNYGERGRLFTEQAEKV